MSIGLCQHTTVDQMCIRSRDHNGDHILVDKTITGEQRFHQIAAQFPVDPDADYVADSLRDFMEEWYDRWAGPGEAWNFRDLAESIVDDWLPNIVPNQQNRSE